MSIESTVKFTKGWPRQRFLDTLAKHGFKPGDLVLNKDVLQVKESGLPNALARLSIRNGGRKRNTQGLALLGFNTTQRSTDEDIREQLLEIWSYKKVQQAYAESNPSLLTSLKELGKTHTKLHRAMKHRAEKSSKTNKRAIISVKQQVNSLHPEFPSMYNLVSSRTSAGNQQDLAERLRSAFYQGINISPTALRDSDDPGKRKLFREVYHAGKCDFGFRIESPKKTIARVTGIKPQDFTFSSRKNELLREITENAQKLVFLVTNLIDPTGKYFQNGFAGYFPPIRSIDEQVRIHTQGRNYIRSDFVVASNRRNCAVEVKSGTTVQSAKSLTEKYQNWENFGTDGARLDSVVAVLQMNEKIVAQMRGPLRDLNIKTVSGEKFMEYFAKAIEALEGSSYHAHVAKAVHGVHSLANIYRFHEQIVFQPHVVLKQNSREVLLHHNKVLRSLTKCLEKEYKTQNLK